ncbi:hypothetical protein VaNZ11_016605, partial [Volvox africanus]
RLRHGWKAYIDSPAEKAFVTKRLSDIASGPSSTRTTAGGGASSSRQPAPREFQLFWQALLGLPPIVAGSFLTLPSNVYLLGSMCWGSSLLVRHCYRGIFDRMMELHSSNMKRQFLITGVPMNSSRLGCFTSYTHRSHSYLFRDVVGSS